MLLRYIGEWELETEEFRIGLDVAESFDGLVRILIWQSHNGEIRVVDTA